MESVRPHLPESNLQVWIKDQELLKGGQWKKMELT